MNRVPTVRYWGFSRAILVSVYVMFASFSALAVQPVRIATWNVQRVGEPGSSEFNAVAAVLGRIQPDIVAINEVSGQADIDNLNALAVMLEYPFVAVSLGGEFGGLHNAVLSKYRILNSTSWGARALSPDPTANDLTRYIFAADIELSGPGDALRLFALHLKSGSANADEYRRALEAVRANQAAEQTPAQLPWVILGDLNHDVGDGPLTPAQFTSEPPGMPNGFITGWDIQALMASAGLQNDPFTYLTTHAAVLYAPQLDGSDTTRPESGRRLDYILGNAIITARGAAAQVYDCGDEHLTGGLPLYGAPLGATVCATASDHLPVFADLSGLIAPPPTNPTLTVTRTGTGAMTSTPAGIDCGAVCSASFSAGTVVTLQPLPGLGYRFNGWGV